MQSTVLGCDQESRMTQVESVFKLPREMRNTQINTKQGRKKEKKVLCKAESRGAFLLKDGLGIMEVLLEEPGLAL